VVAEPRPTDLSPSAAARARRAELRQTVGGPSRLSERAAAEYHYVIRDLRNIGILVLVLAALLTVAAIGVNLLHLGQA
jgi:hypothetical protein